MQYIDADMEARVGLRKIAATCKLLIGLKVIYFIKTYLIRYYLMYLFKILK